MTILTWISWHILPSAQQMSWNRRSQRFSCWWSPQMWPWSAVWAPPRCGDVTTCSSRGGQIPRPSVEAWLVVECCLHPVNKSQIEKILLYINITLDLITYKLLFCVGSHWLHGKLSNLIFCVRKDRVSSDSTVQVKTLKMIKRECKSTLENTVKRITQVLD